MPINEYLAKRDKKVKRNKKEWRCLGLGTPERSPITRRTQEATPKKNTPKQDRHVPNTTVVKKVKKMPTP